MVHAHTKVPVESTVRSELMQLVTHCAMRANTSWCVSTSANVLIHWIRR